MTDVTIYQALNAVMKQVGAVRKLDQNNSPGSGGYRFRGIDAVTNAVYPAFCDHGVFVTPTVKSYDYGTVTVGKNRTEMGHARLTVEFTFYGPAGDSVTATTAGEAFDSGDKATAKAHSVALRTALLQALMLPTDEPDPDSHSYERGPVRAADQDEIDAADVARGELLADLSPLGWTEDTLVKAMWERKKKNLRNTRDVVMIKGFGKELLAEGVLVAADPVDESDPAPSDIAGNPTGEEASS